MRRQVHCVCIGRGSVGALSPPNAHPDASTSPCSPWRTPSPLTPCSPGRTPSPLTQCSPGCIQLMPAVNRLTCGSSSGLAGGFPCKRRRTAVGEGVRTFGSSSGLAGGIPCKRKKRRGRKKVLFCPSLTRDPGRRRCGLLRCRLWISPAGLLIAAQLLPLPLTVRAG